MSSCSAEHKISATIYLASQTCHAAKPSRFVLEPTPLLFSSDKIPVNSTNISHLRRTHVCCTVILQFINFMLNACLHNHSILPWNKWTKICTNIYAEMVCLEARSVQTYFFHCAFLHLNYYLFLFFICFY